jgi:hypothetical protein
MISVILTVDARPQNLNLKAINNQSIKSKEIIILVKNINLVFDINKCVIMEQPTYLNFKQ